MALGDVTTIISGQSAAVELLASATAANGVPTDDDGIEINSLALFGDVPREIRAGVKSTAGSGTMTVTLRVWMRLGGTIGWVVAKPLNVSSAAPHTAVAIPETSADAIAHTEPVAVLDGADRIYLEIVAIAGTSTAVTGYAVVAR